MDEYVVQNLKSVRKALGAFDVAGGGITEDTIKDVSQVLIKASNALEKFKNDIALLGSNITGDPDFKLSAEDERLLENIKTALPKIRRDEDINKRIDHLITGPFWNQLQKFENNLHILEDLKLGHKVKRVENEGL